jgi:hypothetical protein
MRRKTPNLRERLGIAAHFANPISWGFRLRGHMMCARERVQGLDHELQPTGFLRRLPPSDLQRYFAARDIPFSEQVDWTAKPVALLVSMKVAIEALPEREREQVFEDFERIDHVSDEIGQRALRSLIEHNEALLHRFHSCNGSEARGLFVLLTGEKAFDNALATAYAERMRHGRSWSGYCLPAPLAPSKSPSDIARLEADLSTIFREFDGTGRKLKVDWFEHRTCDLKGAALGQVIHYSVYVEGLPECSMEFDREEPKRRTRRPVIEAAICCDPVSGMLGCRLERRSPVA